MNVFTGWTKAIPEKREEQAWAFPLSSTERRSIRQRSVWKAVWEKGQRYGYFLKNQRSILKDDTGSLCCKDTEAQTDAGERSGSMAYIEFQHVKKFYGKKNEAVIKALDDTNFTVEEGELAVILGASGAGKTTALNILGGMDQATQGEVIVAGKHLNKFSEKELVKYRRNDVGFVFQFYNLVPNLTALENVELAVQICKDYLNPEDVLKKVGLEDRMKNFPAQLSGGEQQRVAIARAIAKNPKLLLCDETDRRFGL